MKRLITISAIIMLILLSFSGCKSAESSANGDTPVPGNVFSDIL